MLTELTETLVRLFLISQEFMSKQIKLKIKTEKIKHELITL